MSTHRVVSYNIYLATNRVGVGREQIGLHVSAGTYLTDIPIKTHCAAFTHVVVYTQSSLVEQSTPVALAFSDTNPSVSNVSFVDYDLDNFEVGGSVTYV